MPGCPVSNLAPCIYTGEIVTGGTGIFLGLALLLALGFECVNGFHDTANAVATVIYTHTLKPTQAVVWSGIWNLLGVLFSAGTVAYGVVALLPVELVLNVGSAAGYAMVFSLLIAAIIWNAGTWYLGLPASSSHSLIGAIMGVGLANSLMQPGHKFGEGVNWPKVYETFTALLTSPVIGFSPPGRCCWWPRRSFKVPALYEPPKGDQPPPLGIRALLVLTCTLVSFFHGSNDGQKGQGLIMLILIGVLPGAYACKMKTPRRWCTRSPNPRSRPARPWRKKPLAVLRFRTRTPTRCFPASSRAAGSSPIRPLPPLPLRPRRWYDKLNGKNSFNDVNLGQRRGLRTDLYLASGSLDKLVKLKKLAGAGSSLRRGVHQPRQKLTQYIPDWVKVAVAFALGLGTMVGWKRIVVTVGEKIGKAHLTYGQGAAAELVAAGTIGLADHFGLPVSTTHILSSGVAGTMAANGSGLQKETLRNILLAWVLTLPVCVLLGAGLFSGGLVLIFNVFGLK